MTWGEMWRLAPARRALIVRLNCLPREKIFSEGLFSQFENRASTSGEKRFAEFVYLLQQCASGDKLDSPQQPTVNHGCFPLCRGDPNVRQSGYKGELARLNFRPVQSQHCRLLGYRVAKGHLFNVTHRAKLQVEGENMGTSNQSWEFPAVAANSAASFECWYAVQTRARHERVVARRLLDSGVTTFLPTVTEVHRWSDRRKTVELPLFGCYLFVRLAPGGEERLRVLQVDSVLRFVGIRGLGTPIPDSQIDAVRILVDEQLPYCSHPFLKIGQRVRIRGGALDGMEGILSSRNGDRSLVISVDALQRSMAVRVQGYDIEPI